MEYLGISFSVGNLPELDPGFLPFAPWMDAYLQGAEQPLEIAIEREGGKVATYHTHIRGAAYAEANYRYVERLMKFLLWSRGGWRISLRGSAELAARLRRAYAPGGVRAFDAQFMEQVYGRPLEIVDCGSAPLPAEKESAVPIGGHLDGCRIGFDAGGSDRKVSAVIDGKSVYSEEVVWHPKTESDPAYHYQGIVDALRTAASKLPRVDAIGVSSAGVFIDNQPMVSSLFLRVPAERRKAVLSIYERAAKEIGDVPLQVANDGDVTTLAGAMSLGTGNIMGIAMGTSEAVGYVDHAQQVMGWLNELAFAPVDLHVDAAIDEWSGDTGVGCKYFSQDAAIKLAPAAGIALPEELTLGEKLKQLQALCARGCVPALKIFQSIGAYLAHTLPLYSKFYDIRWLLVMGRVTSGVGGEQMIETCNRILQEEYPAHAASMRVMLPDEKARRVGQSVAAASLPAI